MNKKGDTMKKKYNLLEYEPRWALSVGLIPLLCIYRDTGFVQMPFLAHLTGMP